MELQLNMDVCNIMCFFIFIEYFVCDSLFHIDAIMWCDMLCGIDSL